jgi:2-dehydro-3-deoxyphosphogluconate aldolase/(4S)-4-hydroxy-2-oxoglutarate aldolase
MISNRDDSSLIAGVLEGIGRQRVLPVLRLASAAQAVAAARTVLAAGLTVVELTATTVDWAAALQAVRAEPAAVVGLGTVTDAETARAAVAVGAAFLVSPWAAPAVREVADAAGVPFLEGALTPTEVAAAAARGPVKIFPASSVGPGHLRALRPVLPTAIMVPTGGIRLEDVPTWLAAGAHAVGVGTDLLAGDLAERLDALHARPGWEAPGARGPAARAGAREAARPTEREAPGARGPAARAGAREAARPTEREAP